MRRFANALMVLFFLHTQTAGAEQIALRCSGYSIGSKTEPFDFSVMIDIEKRRVLDFGHGEGVETQEFSETSINAIQRTGIGFTYVLEIDRITGKFDLSWVAVHKDRSSDPKRANAFQGTCQQTQRKF